MPELVGAVDSAEVFEVTNGLRRASCSRALSALSRSRNQVFSGHCQLASTSPLEFVILSAIAIKVLQQGLYQGILVKFAPFDSKIEQIGRTRIVTYVHKSTIMVVTRSREGQTPQASGRVNSLQMFDRATSGYMCHGEIIHEKSRYTSDHNVRLCVARRSSIHPSGPCHRANCGAPAPIAIRGKIASAPQRLRAYRHKPNG